MLNQTQITKLKLSKVESHLNYLGILTDFEKLSQDINKPIRYNKLNPQQHFLFKRVLHGLKMYKKEEIALMHWDKKRRITKVWKRSQHVINEWKQLLAYKESNIIFSIFTHSKLAKSFIDAPFKYMPDYINKSTFKTFGIGYEHLIVKFISCGLLPNNFFQIK
ncbi:MAG: hypothetical protein H8E16_04330 [Flavobacteriales bacterium]|nr:hypothetical protein [Flavobacteriales bacterium]